MHLLSNTSFFFTAWLGPRISAQPTVGLEGDGCTEPMDTAKEPITTTHTPLI